MLTNGALCQTRHIMTCASSVTGVDHSGTALYVVCSNVLSVVQVCMISLVIRGSEGFEKVKCGQKAAVHVTQQSLSHDDDYDDCDDDPDHDHDNDATEHWRAVVPAYNACVHVP